MPPWKTGNNNNKMISMDLSINGISIILSSSSNTGVSFQDNQYQGFDLEFENFTGKLCIIPRDVDDSNGGALMTKQEQQVTAETVNANGETDQALIVEQVDVCTRLYQCTSDDARSASVPGEAATPPSAPRDNELHIACSQQNVSIQELSAILNARPEAASEVDEQGRYPLHVFSQNESLLSLLVDYPRNVQTFVMSLLEAYPEALFTTDNNNNFPFSVVIQEWITNQYDSPAETKRGIVDAVGNRARSTLEYVTSASSSNGVDRDPYVNKFPQVKVSPAVITALKILSTYLNCINECSTASRESQLLVRATMAKQYATIPYLIKILYLIENDGTRQEVISFPIVQRIMFCEESVGEWLSNMLRFGDTPSKRAVDYLQDISKISYFGVTSPSEQDMKVFDNDQKLFISTLESTGHIVPSLTALDDEDKGRAATCNVVWTILSHSISRPLVIGIQSADFCFNVLLLLVFRYATGTNNLVLSGTSNAFPLQTAELWVLSLCVYFLVRLFSECYSIICMSTSAFKSYLLDFWNLVDFVAVVLATAAVTSKTENAIFLALTMAMLWLKFLAYLTAVNMHLATFIMAVVEIVKDIKWFLVVLVLSIFMFGDVIQIITQQSVEDYCSASEPPPEEFCDPEPGPMFLKMFAVLVGDMDLSEFKFSSGIQIIFILFALLGIIILLNVLIAVVSDSYQKSVENSTKLFGRARLDFVIKMVAQENFLRGHKIPSFEGYGLASIAEFFLWFILVVGRLIVLGALIWTAVISEYCLVLLAKATIEESAWWVFCAIVAGLLLTLAVPLVLQDLMERPLRKFAKEHRLSWLRAYLDATVRAGRKCAGTFFGGTGPLNEDETNEEDARVERMEHFMERIASTAKQEIIEKVDAVEQRIIAASDPD